MANEQQHQQQAQKQSGKKYRVIHGSIGLQPGLSYKYTKGDLITDMEPEEAAVHIKHGLLAEER